MRGVPPAVADAILRVQKGYQPAAHDALGPSPNAALLDAEPPCAPISRSVSRRWARRPWWPTRSAPSSTPASRVCWVTGFVNERQALIRTLGERVLSRLA